MCGGRGCMRTLSVLSAQLCYEPKAIRKAKSILKRHEYFVPTMLQVLGWALCIHYSLSLLTGE